MIRCPHCGERLKAKRSTVSGLAFPKPVKRKGRGCAGYLRDSAAKERLKYTNPDSFVRRDGSEVLKGEDWDKRKEELAQRSGGICECPVIVGGGVRQLTPGVVGTRSRCFNPARDPHHKIRRSRGRDDRLSNLEHLCGFHHDLLDPRKPKWTRRGSKAAD